MICLNGQKRHFFWEWRKEEGRCAYTDQFVKDGNQKFMETLDGLYFLHQLKARLLSENDGQRKILEQLLEDQKRQSKCRSVVLNFTKTFFQSTPGPASSPEFCIAQEKWWSCHLHQRFVCDGCGLALSCWLGPVVVSRLFHTGHLEWPPLNLPGSWLFYTPGAVSDEPSKPSSDLSVQFCPKSSLTDFVHKNGELSAWPSPIN